MSSTPTGYIPKSERDSKEPLNHKDSLGLVLKDNQFKPKINNDAIVPDSNTITQAQEDEARHRARNDARHKRRARTGKEAKQRNPTGIIGGALSGNIEDNAENNSINNQVVTDEKIIGNSENRVDEIVRKNSLDNSRWKEKYRKFII